MYEVYLIVQLGAVNNFNLALTSGCPGCIFFSLLRILSLVLDAVDDGYTISRAVNILLFVLNTVDDEVDGVVMLGHSFCHGVDYVVDVGVVGVQFIVMNGQL